MNYVTVRTQVSHGVVSHSKIPVVKERLDYEIGVIKMKGYAKYFLVVGDLLREARERKILTTIRGSVAGSLTTYVLGITNVNPSRV
jgi:DNA polymerase-3 subunit alpha